MHQCANTLKKSETFSKKLTMTEMQCRYTQIHQKAKIFYFFVYIPLHHHRIILSVPGEQLSWLIKIQAESLIDLSIQ